MATLTILSSHDGNARSSAPKQQKVKHTLLAFLSKHSIGSRKYVFYSKEGKLPHEAVDVTSYCLI